MWKAVTGLAAARCGRQPRRWPTRSSCLPEQPRSRSVPSPPTASRCSIQIWTAPRSRFVAFPSMGAPRSIRMPCLLMICLCRMSIGSGKRARGSDTCLMVLILSAFWWLSRRSALGKMHFSVPHSMPAIALCSIVQSDRTRPSSIRWRNAGSTCARRC
ncbi:hypothetical protein D3C72_1669340 [compost metagenome]